MPTLHPRVQATHEHEAQANVQRRQKSEDPNSWTHESQPLDGFTGPLEVFAKDATVIQRTGLLHRMNQRHRIGSLRKLQRHYGNRFVQGLIAQHTVQTRLTVGHSGDVYEQEADRVADAVMQMSQPRSAAQSIVSGPVQALRIQRICGGCEKELRQQPITEEKEEELHRQPLEDEAEEQPIKARTGWIWPSKDRSAMKNARGKAGQGQRVVTCAFKGRQMTRMRRTNLSRRNLTH
jgi:hypothetical protein